MADLPDIDTTQVGYLVYWNAIDDGGASEISAEEALTDGRIVSYTLYDNGWEGTYNSPNGRNHTVRVKNDGWFVAYTDRSNNYGRNQGSPPRGYHDIVNNWVSSSNSTIKGDNLWRSIYNLVSELSNASNLTRDDADAGLYHYEFDTAQASTLLSSWYQSGSSNIVTKTYGWLYTQSTTLHHAAAAGSCGRNDFYTARVQYPKGNLLAYNDESQHDDIYGAVDDSNLAAGTEREGAIVSQESGGANLNVITIWE